jgi:60 kDa SS-A/Ro ribonucleoprotein
MSNALRKVNTKKTAQTEQADSRQVKNNAGGFSFKVSEWDRLERFLILGVDGGTYYVKEKDLTKQNVEFVRELLKSDSTEVINRTINVSVNGRAKSNSAALFILALAMNTDGVNKQHVKNAVISVARTSTHLFEYAQYLENLGGWGRAKRESIVGWYEAKGDKLPLQVVKYRQRNGWTHRDMLRLAHPKNIDPQVASFILGKDHDAGGIIQAFEQAQASTNIDEVVTLIKDHRLPWETIPTPFHKEPKLWRTLFEVDALGQTALLRNTVRLARLGMFDDMRFAAEYAARLADSERIQKGRVHPINYLNAAVTFKDGQAQKDDKYGLSMFNLNRVKNWESNSKISKALDIGFYNAFKTIEPANKRTMFAIDVSLSMSQQSLGIDLSCAQVSAAVAMVGVRTEPYAMTRGFSNQFIDLGITENMSLDDVMRSVSSRNHGGTDCALPMVWAAKNKVEVDTFCVITDNETWYGNIHPHQALKEYRQKMGIDAKLAVMGVSATEFTIADPSDQGQMDFVGFDSAAPKIFTDFSAGRI